MPSPLSSAAWCRFLLTASVGLALDLWTKWLAFHKLAIQVMILPDGAARVYSAHPYRLIPGWLEFEVIANQGAVFGLAQGQRVLFIVASFAASLFLIYLFLYSDRKWFYQIILGMLLAGVLGNLYDRIKFGYVRDMIHALPQWPHLFKWIFNVADSLLCVGVTLMILLGLLPSKSSGPRSR